jgi:GTP:adenosylcobinamide-phosphate guanylyltransferase
MTSPASRTIPVIVTAGDRGAAREVYGESKIYLEVAGRPLVAHVVAQLQRVPEVNSVYVVGDAQRLNAVFADPAVKAEITKPLTVVDQFDNLFQNSWETYRRTLPGAPPEGRDPETEEDRDHQVLYLSGDLPFITPEEISEFIRLGQASGCEYAIGLSPERALDLFHPRAEDESDGIAVTYFNIREDRLKQSNLHLTKPAKIVNRHYAQDMYEHRKQRELGSMVGLAWRLLHSEEGGGTIAFFFLLIVLSGWLDRHRLRGLADRARQIVSIERVERALGRLMKTELRLIVPEIGGCAVDVDTEQEYDAICKNYDRLYTEVKRRAAEQAALTARADEQAGPKGGTA